MTQRIFDVENEKDMADLWDILPDRVFKIHTSEEHIYYSDGDETQYFDVSDLIAINWHDKTEITRPIQEATEQDLGKIERLEKQLEIAVEAIKAVLHDEFILEHADAGLVMYLTQAEYKIKDLEK